MASTMIKYFEMDHLPENLRRISEPICDLAKLMEESLSDGPEKSDGMRKLLEAMNCFVRAGMETPPSYYRWSKAPRKIEEGTTESDCSVPEPSNKPFNFFRYRRDPSKKR